VIPWSPLASGLLAGALGKEQAGRRGEEGVSKEIEKYS
jgi:aryl-alcohol dehydrogenase-like predicted oxidoreductase